ncbi:MAG: protein kinase [Myxococcales bacterium]|nr:protein kinase [Myxococcales bacterium]MBL0193884.1 protein kinase [Myxococcales bacterium]HQY64915.1 protein kinase [Polyangiaceae bacterium]
MGSLVGQVIDGRYRVDAVIALGGMGAVLRGTHLVLGQSVAIKIMLDATMRDPLMRERVFREARILAQVRSPAIAAIFDAGLLPDGTLYIVMELLEGDELEALITKRTLNLTQTARLLAQVCEGLADAHAQGIVHRDLKPANIFVVKKLSGELTAKIIDFGISKRVGEVNETTTVTTIIGSPYYMAPEQASSSRDVDHRADIWSLGVILYRVVVGRLPFEGTISAVLAGIRTQDPRFPDGTDPAFRRVIQGCLEKELSRRYQSALEVQAALLPLAEPPRRDSSISQGAVAPAALSASQAARAFVESSGTEKTTLHLSGTGASLAHGRPVPYTDEGEMVTTRMASPLSGGGPSPPNVILPLAGRRQEPLARTAPIGMVAPAAPRAPAAVAAPRASVPPMPASPPMAPVAPMAPIAPMIATPPAPMAPQSPAAAGPRARKGAALVWVLVSVLAVISLAAIANRVRHAPEPPSAPDEAPSGK